MSQFDRTVVPTAMRQCKNIWSLAAVLAVAMTFAASATPGAENARTLESRVQRQEDLFEIRQLMVVYGHCLDTRDFAAYSKLFARNGAWSGNLGGKFVTVSGQAAIQKMMEDAFGPEPYDATNVSSAHLVSNVLIKLHGDRATVLSKWTVVGKDEDGGPVVRMIGHYDDTVVREDGEWKFLHRTAPRDIPAQGGS